MASLVKSLTTCQPQNLIPKLLPIKLVIGINDQGAYLAPFLVSDVLGERA